MAPLRWHIRGAAVLEEIANRPHDVREAFERLNDQLQLDPRHGEGIARSIDRPKGYFNAHFDRALVEYRVHDADPGPGVDLEHIKWFPPPTRVKDEPLPELEPPKTPT